MTTLTGAFNFRDLGGHHTDDGRRTRFGQVFRSNSLQDLTPGDLEIVRRQLGLTAIVDLRSAREVQQDGFGPLQDEALRYVHLPLPQEAGDYDPSRIETRLVDRYTTYLDLGKENLVKALEAISLTQPVVFHCSAGKDRTGVLAALVLRCLGVPVDAVVSDYSAGEHARNELVYFLRRRPSYVQRLARLPSSALDCQPSVMREFLYLLDARYGGARSWALTSGLSEPTLLRLESILLEPAVRDRRAQ